MQIDLPESLHISSDLFLKGLAISLLRLSIFEYNRHVPYEPKDDFHRRGENTQFAFVIQSVFLCYYNL